MRAVIFSLLCVFVLQACGNLRIQKLRDPATGHVVECKGSGKLPEVTDVNRCIHDYQEKGYELFYH